jgi:hypothetical protein
MKTTSQSHLIKFLLLPALFLPACGALENMEGMKKTTEGMADITKHMGETTDKLSKKTDDVYITSALLKRLARQGGAVQNRQNALQLVDSEKTLEAKLVNSAIYFQAFEFQLWNNLLEDDAITRQNLFRDGVEEFLIYFKGLAGKREEPNPLSTDNDMMQILALSGTVEQINLIQIESSIRTPFAPVSVLDLIIEGLKQKNNRNDGKAVPMFAEKVLQHEDNAAYLLLSRYNMYPAMVVDKIYDVSQMGICDKLKLFLKKNVVVDFAKLNAAEISEATRYLKVASDARDTLKTLGYKADLNKNIRKILGKAIIKDDPVGGEGKADATDKFKAALAEFIKN